MDDNMYEPAGCGGQKAHYYKLSTLSNDRKIQVNAGPARGHTSVCSGEAAITAGCARCGTRREGIGTTAQPKAAG
jgi:hypothetical protein